MYRSLGWSRADCAKFLHVSEGCVHNWERGRHAIPYAAYRLLRLHIGYELPGRDWDGWSISRGKLCTPEGHHLSPLDAKWWHLLVRRAETGYAALRELSRMKRLAGGAGGLAAGGAPCGGTPPARQTAMAVSADPQGLRRAAPLDLSNGHISNATHRFGVFAGYGAIGHIAKPVANCVNRNKRVTGGQS